MLQFERFIHPEREDMPDIDAFVASIYRKGNPFIPAGDTIIKENDEIYFISSESNIGPVSYTHLTLPTKA